MQLTVRPLLLAREPVRDPVKGAKKVKEFRFEHHNPDGCQPKRYGKNEQDRDAKSNSHTFSLAQACDCRTQAPLLAAVEPTMIRHQQPDSAGHGRLQVAQIIAQSLVLGL